jgi:hypothetical protein
MLLATHQKLAEQIVQCFRAAPYLSAVEIAQRVQVLQSVTQRAVFKELAKLVDQGVLVKARGKYAVKVTWILELLQLGEDLTKHALNPQSINLQIPGPGQRFRWRFRDIRRMDSFWVQLMFVLFTLSTSKHMYVWSPHFWFHLLDLNKELQAMRAMQKGGNMHFLMIGSDSFIDRLPSKYWNPKVYHWSYAAGPFASERRRYFDVIDDYILTVLFPESFVKELDALCERVRSKQELALIARSGLFTRPVEISLTLEHNTAKAGRLRGKFQEYFGHAKKGSKGAEHPTENTTTKSGNE